MQIAHRPIVVIQLANITTDSLLHGNNTIQLDRQRRQQQQQHITIPATSVRRALARIFRPTLPTLQHPHAAHSILHTASHTLILLHQDRSATQEVEGAGRVESDARRQNERVTSQDTQDVLHHGTHVHGILGAHSFHQRLSLLREEHRGVAEFRRHLLRVSLVGRLAHLRQSIHLRLVQSEIPSRLQIFPVLLLSKQKAQTLALSATQRKHQSLFPFYSLQSLRIDRLRKAKQQQLLH